jgi:hypothetical protein
MIVRSLLILLLASSAASAQAPVVDPTKNVLDKVTDAVRRLDDMRDMDRALSELRYTALRDTIALRADYEDKLRRAEASRLDAIRLVDTNNVSVANERATATAQALAKKGDDSALVLSTQVTKSADDVRTLVKTTADEQNRNLQQQFTAIQAQFTSIGSRLTALEQTGAEGIGKQKYRDPADAALADDVRKLLISRSDIAGVGTGRSDVFAWVQTALLLVVAIGGLFFAMRRSQS